MGFWVAVLEEGAVDAVVLAVDVGGVILVLAVVAEATLVGAGDEDCFGCAGAVLTGGWTAATVCGCGVGWVG
jgi:hypothetical protein